jgi:hypothetical protein
MDNLTVCKNNNSVHFGKNSVHKHKLERTFEENIVFLSVQILSDSDFTVFCLVFTWRCMFFGISPGLSE